MGSGDLGTWLWEVATKGSDDLRHRLLMVAWDVFWGGCRSAKLCVFPCKVAAAGDEGQVVCEAVAG